MRAPQPRRNDILNLTSPMKKVPPIIFGALLFFTPSFASAAFTYSRSITIDHTKVSANLSDFPVEVTLTNVTSLKNPAGGGHVQSSSGYDVYFYSDAALTSRLPAEREVFNGTAGTYVGWVKIPAVSSSADTIFYMAYGDSGISSDPNSDATYGATSTWDASFEGVYHLTDGTTLSGVDSTNSFNGTVGSTATGVAGLIDGGASFSGENSLNNRIDLNDLDLSGDFTISAWVKTNGSQVSYARVSAKDSGATYNWSLAVNGLQPNFYAYDGTNIPIATTANLSDATWTHLVGVMDKGTNLTLYKNAAAGTPVADTTGTIVNNEDANIGYGATGDGAPFKGVIDEVRFSSTIRTADWILAEYNNQSSPSTFYRLGNEISGGTSMVAPARFQLFGGFLRTIGGYLRLR